MSLPWTTVWPILFKIIHNLLSGIWNILHSFIPFIKLFAHMILTYYKLLFKLSIKAIKLKEIPSIWDNNKWLWGLTFIKLPSHIFKFKIWVSILAISFREETHHLIFYSKYAKFIHSQKAFIKSNALFQALNEIYPMINVNCLHPLILLLFKTKPSHICWSVRM